ncbi:MAG TPA: hypothetical protein VGP72_14695 [Planctomycetota bacterium]
MAKRTPKLPQSEPPVIIDPIDQALSAAQKSATKTAAKITKASDLTPYVQVLDPKGINLSKMERWPIAVELLDTFWTQHKRTIIKKARQLGVSWDFALYTLFHMGWKGYRTVASVNYTQEAASELIWRMRTLWQTMPAAMRPPLRKGTSWSSQSVELANGSRAMALATKDVSGAGYTYSLMGIDEAGLIPDLASNWAALLPAVEFGELHMFSTPRVEAGKFAEVWKLCLSGLGDPFVHREIFWNERPGRDEAWKQARIKELGQRDFDREYGGKFSRPGACYFADETITPLRAGVKQPIKILWDGHLLIYEMPNPADTAVIGSDVAEGFEDGDASCAHVLSRRTGRQLAKLYGRIDVTQWAEYLVDLAKMYGNAWIGVEANNHGHAVCMWIYKHLRWKKLYRETREAKGALGAPSERLGILTDVASKPAMLAELSTGLRKGSIAVFDAQTVEELSTYLSLPGGGYGAQPGQHDDCVTGLMIAQNCRGRACPRMI